MFRTSFIRMLQKKADHLYTDCLFQSIVAEAANHIRIVLYPPFPCSDRTADIGIHHQFVRAIDGKESRL